MKQCVYSSISYSDFIEMSLEAVSEGAKKGRLNSEVVEEIVFMQSILSCLVG